MFNLKIALQHFPVSGHVLSAAEETALHCSITILSQQTKKNITFWGKLLGYSGDYFLCQASGDDALSGRRTYYSTDGAKTWTLLEDVTASQTEICDQIRGLFMGDPSYEYRIEKILPAEDEVVPPPPPAQAGGAMESGQGEGTHMGGETDDGDDADEDADENDDTGDNGAEDPTQDEPEQSSNDHPNGSESDVLRSLLRKNNKKNQRQIVAIKESIRLAYFVQMHDHHCAVVPRGLFVRAHDGRIVRNKTYEGLDPAAAGKLLSYYHLRDRRSTLQTTATTTSSSTSPSSTSSIDFLENLSDDIPRGVWSLKYDPLLDIVVGQNMLYMGSMFFLQPNSTICGQFYVGDGQVNLDLCFML